MGDRGREESEGMIKGLKGEREMRCMRVGDRGREESEGEDQGRKGEFDMHESGR